MASLKKRGSSFYIQFYVAGNKQKRVNLHTASYQIAKEKLRRFESAQAAGDDLPLPTRTPIPDIVTAYIGHIRIAKTAKTAQTDIYYLRDMFGSVCDALKITSRKPSTKAKKKPPKAGVDARTKSPVIAADCLEAIRTGDITKFTAEYHNAKSASTAKLGPQFGGLS